jgi:hypothetical protein
MEQLCFFLLLFRPFSSLSSSHFFFVQSLFSGHLNISSHVLLMTRSKTLPFYRYSFILGK